MYLDDCCFVYCILLVFMFRIWLYVCLFCFWARPVGRAFRNILYFILVCFLVFICSVLVCMVFNVFCILAGLFVYELLVGFFLCMLFCMVLGR